MSNIVKVFLFFSIILTISALFYVMIPQATDEIVKGNDRSSQISSTHSHMNEKNDSKSTFTDHRASRKTKTFKSRRIALSDKPIENDAEPSKTEEKEARPHPQRSISYSDPVNDRVLGDPKWMAEIPEDEKQRIQRILDQPHEDPDLIRYARQRSIAEVSRVIRRCFFALKKNKPEAKGRIIVSWNATSTGNIENVELGPNIHLRYPQFATCIITESKGLTYRSDAFVDIKVAYPFILR